MFVIGAKEKNLQSLQKIRKLMSKPMNNIHLKKTGFLILIDEVIDENSVSLLEAE